MGRERRKRDRRGKEERRDKKEGRSLLRFCPVEGVRVFWKLKRMRNSSSKQQG